MANKYLKKVIVLGHDDGYGGAQTAFRELFKIINTKEYIVKVILLTDKPNNQLSFNKDILLGTIAHKGPFLYKFIKKFFGLSLAVLRARKFKPDIFITVGLNNSALTIASLLNKKCFKIGQDFIATRHYKDKMWRKSNFVFNGLAVQAPSMLERWQSNNDYLTNINWLPCFPTPPTAGVICQYTSEFHGVIKLAYFGRLAGNKGLSLLLKAFSIVKSSSNVVLDLWGKGDEEEHLHELVDKFGLNSQVKFKGTYPMGEAGARLMASYDALVLCSTGMEGLPLILLEAMAYGLPFLATNIGAIRDCCVNNPDVILVEPTQEGISRGLQILISQIENRNFDSKRLRDYYETNFSHKVMANRWYTCLNDPEPFFQ